MSVIPIVPVKRFGRTDRGVRTWTIDCPWCGREHTHGAAPGHRVAHCVDSDNPGYVITRTHPSDTTALTQPPKAAHVTTDQTGDQSHEHPYST